MQERGGMMSARIASLDCSLACAELGCMVIPMLV